MPFFTRRNKQIAFSRQEALACIPVRNDSVHWHTLESGDIIIEYVLPLKPLFQALHRRFQSDAEPPTRKLQLDSMGSKVWSMIDGQQTTLVIIQQFARHYTITLQEAETSVTKFLLELGRRGLIGMH